MLLDKHLKRPEFDNGTILLIHRVEKGEFDEKYVTEGSYIFKDEAKATEVIKQAAIDFCNNIKSVLDHDSAFSIDYDWVSGTRRSLTVDYNDDHGEHYREKLYLTSPRILPEGESK